MVNKEFRSEPFIDLRGDDSSKVNFPDSPRGSSRDSINSPILKIENV